MDTPRTDRTCFVSTAIIYGRGAALLQWGMYRADIPFATLNKWLEDMKKHNGY